MENSVNIEKDIAAHRKFWKTLVGLKKSIFGQTPGTKEILYKRGRRMLMINRYRGMLQAEKPVTLHEKLDLLRRKKLLRQKEWALIFNVQDLANQVFQIEQQCGEALSNFRSLD
ncbi:unnamed protein product [Blepharisma stoltei]|uniref:Uncharacterized protein n=1 Tax=Blepharisma stoltei TaxID=1481888 RepID=A0AAU9JNZ3_9CILI|nr:unnamed protein product [Blepharisma stoltei]